jgi:hypothetical protein
VPPTSVATRIVIPETPSVLPSPQREYYPPAMVGPTKNISIPSAATKTMTMIQVQSRVPLGEDIAHLPSQASR